MFFSKTKYVQAWSCMKGAWISRHHPELAPLDARALAHQRTGTEVGELARGLFGAWVDVTARREDGSPDLPRMISNTAEEMEKGTPVICEASFSFEGLYCAVDLLRKEGEGWAIYEVKSSSEGTQDQYIADVAYQKHVLEHCGVTVTGVYLVCIDTSYVLAESGLDLSGLFKITDLRAEAEEAQRDVPGILSLAERVLPSDAEPDAELGEACRDCRFFRYCTRDLPTPNVFDLYRLGRDKMVAYYRRGLVSFESLEAAGVIRNPTQLRQMDYQLRDRGTHVEAGAIREYLSELTFPLYFLDFETMAPVIPLYAGTHPYEQIPFQYSLHCVEHEGGEVLHREFLAESGPDPRRAVAEALCRDIPAYACVLAYHKGTECGILNRLADLFPDLADHLHAVAGGIVDLLIPFQKGWYYNRAMGGSFSIKSVLPAVCPDDPELDYHALEGVQNGEEAMGLFPQIRYMEPAQREQARSSLLAYCRLDTLALVKVWEELRRAAGTTA